MDGHGAIGRKFSLRETICEIQLSIAMSRYQGVDTRFEMRQKTNGYYIKLQMVDVEAFKFNDGQIMKRKY